MATRKKEEQTAAAVQSAENDEQTVSEVQSEETEKVTQPAQKVGYYDELVPVKLFRDDNRYKDDVFVAVNGKTMLIKRGEKVMIPRKFALVLENSEEQDARATETAHSYAEKEQVINMD